MFQSVPQTRAPPPPPAADLFGRVHVGLQVLGQSVVGRGGFLPGSRGVMIPFLAGIGIGIIDIRFWNRFQYNKKIDLCRKWNWNKKFLKNDENPIPTLESESYHLYYWAWRVRRENLCQFLHNVAGLHVARWIVISSGNRLG